MLRPEASAEVFLHGSASRFGDLLPKSVPQVPPPSPARGSGLGYGGEQSAALALCWDRLS